MVFRIDSDETAHRKTNKKILKSYFELLQRALPSEKVSIKAF